MQHNISSFVLIAGTVILLSCAHSLRKPADADRFATPRLTTWSKNFYATVSADSFNESNCSAFLSETAELLEHMDWQDAVNATDARDVEGILQALWNGRVALHDKLPLIGQACHKEAKRVFMAVRYLEDYLAETTRAIAPMDPAKIDFQKQPVPLRGSSPRYLVYYRDGRGELDLRPGDLLLTRGVTFLSAMISRLGDASQFSHVVYVGNDPKDGQLKTIESYVGKGVDFYDMDFALKNENARILILRPRDSQLAQASSTKIAQLVRDRITAKRKIKYDYKLDFDDRATLSCAEVSDYAIELGSGGAVRIPEHRSQLTGSLDLLENLGVKPGPTYAPGDMEVDSRFEIIGEFRDLGISRDSRQKDAILSSLVKWMDDHGYELRRNFKARMTLPIWIVRRTFLWPLVKRAFQLPDFSKEVPVRMLRTMSMMNDIGEVMLNVVKQADAEYEKKTGLPMNYHQLVHVLEQFREDDWKLYQNPATRRQSTLHKLFRPDLDEKDRCQRLTASGPRDTIPRECRQ